MGSGEGAAPVQADGCDLTVMNDAGNFDADAFGVGLSLQKTACPLRCFVAYPGYDFGRYAHGAYGPALTRAGSRIRGTVKRTPEIGPRFAAGEAQAICGRFRESAEDKKDDPALSEIGASPCRQVRLKPKDGMRELVAGKRRFTMDRRARAWADLEKLGAVGA